MGQAREAAPNLNFPSQGRLLVRRKACKDKEELARQVDEEWGVERVPSRRNHMCKDLDARETTRK